MIPADRLERNPLITEEGMRTLNRILQHPGAPRWNFATGDRLVASDLPLVDVYREMVHTARSPLTTPPPEMLAWVRARREKVLLFRDLLPEGFPLERDWGYVPTMSREDVALRVETVVPWDEDLSRLVVYDTSGTTGHAIKVPHHPLAMAQNHALMEYALARHGVRPPFGPDAVACVNLGAQEANTVAFANVFSVWDQAGFAKVNLSPREWRSIELAQEFFKNLAPLFLTGDPVGYAELLRWEIPVAPSALISTAVALGAEFKRKLERALACPVIDWYSLTETGPLAYSCPLGRGLHVLPHDVYVEAVDERGFPVPTGERGELAVTGGHNPYLPLLRFRTGDWGRLDASPCPCGESTPRILGLEGRQPVFFRGAGGAVVNAVDVGRVLRRFAVVQHEVVQRADGACDVAVRTVPGLPVDLEEVRESLSSLLGPGVELRVRPDEELGQRLGRGKATPYRSELPQNG